MNQALLPSGFMDRLPPLAAQEFQTVHKLITHFMAFGYSPVNPPLAEYSETMLAGLSEKATTRYMQVMDPISGRMLALRADITGQISRIAATTLKDAARPLRLCYAGQRICATPDALQAQRQSKQIGLEYIGGDDLNGVAELIAVACHSLSGFSLGDLTVEISYPPLLNALLDSFAEEKRPAIQDAVANKNTKSLREHGAELLASLLEGAGTLEETASQLTLHDNDTMHTLAQKLRALGEVLNRKEIDAHFHVDLLEHTNTEYYSDFSFAIFSSKPGLELGRGGMYKIGDENAVGFTFYMDDVLPHLPEPKLPPLVALPHSISCEQAELIQKQGYRTVYSDDTTTEKLDALGVGYVWRDGKITLATTE